MYSCLRTFTLAGHSARNVLLPDSSVATYLPPTPLTPCNSDLYLNIDSSESPSLVTYLVIFMAPSTTWKSYFCLSVYRVYCSLECVLCEENILFTCSLWYPQHLEQGLAHEQAVKSTECMIITGTSSTALKESCFIPKKLNIYLYVFLTYHSSKLAPLVSCTSWISDIHLGMPMGSLQVVECISDFNSLGCCE